MREEVAKLQNKMHDEGIDAYYIPSSDFHGSEYMHPYFKVREFISGFTGSAGDMIITSDAAYLWTDGRYFLQAEQQLDGSGIELMRMGEEGVPTLTGFMASLADEFTGASEGNFTIGFDGRVVSDSFISDMESERHNLSGSIIIKCDKDIAGMVWEDRPDLSTNGLWRLPMESAGESAGDKIERVRSIMREHDADYLAVSDLATIAWMLNLRGSDVAYTPVFYAHLLMSPDGIRLYLTDDAIKSGAEEILKESIGGGAAADIRRYGDFHSDIERLDFGEDRCFMADNFMSYSLYSSLLNKGCIIDANSEVSMLKAVKNDTEISCARNAHIRDGVAVTKFIKWIKDETSAGRLQSEISAAEHLEMLRKEQEGFIEPSFSTIAGYGGNGAIVHYDASPESNAEIKPCGFLLVDSGGQYTDGTTDITRTIAVGPLTEEMIRDYTYTLKAHIAYARMRYEEGMSGKFLDDMVRKPMRDAGLDFKHGISHGVGHVLGVHEAAAVIRETAEYDAGIKAGMIMSDEPGVYMEGQYGIRIENLVLYTDDGNGGVVNEPLTCVPYERAAIDRALLDDAEIEWVNDYHRRVKELLMPLLDPETAAFLEDAAGNI